jgi:hypothetical protein
MPTNSVILAVMEKFRASVAAAGTGGIHFDEAAEQSALPHVVIEDGGEVPAWLMDPTYLETTSLVITVRAATLETVESIAGTLKDLLDAQRGLPLTGTTQVKCLRGRYQRGLERQRGPNGQRVYFGRLEYEIEVTRRRAAT